MDHDTLRELATKFLRGQRLAAGRAPINWHMPASRHLTLGQGRDIARAYDAMPAHYPSGPVAASWLAMAQDELAQFEYISHFVEILTWPWRDTQPYGSSAALRYDVLQRERLFVFMGGDAHPCRSALQTFRGRAVHDIFGHALAGSSFSPDGELMAWRAHVQLYREKSWGALATDNLGQACAYYFAPWNEDRAPAERRWPEQKMNLLPENLWRELLP